MGNRTALVLGATGLVGEQCLHRLVSSPIYDKVMVLARREPEFQHPKLESLIVNFDKLEDYKDRLKCNDVYCAMGTTIGKAGSQKAFRQVDYEYPLKVAELALQNGAKRFLLVSSLGADAHSSVFYSRTKGELEEALRKLGFETLIILRPSILLGNRKEKRRGEELGRFVAEHFSFLFAGPLKKYRGTPVDMLARVMVQLAIGNIRGEKVVENDEIFELDLK